MKENLLKIVLCNVSGDSIDFFWAHNWNVWIFYLILILKKIVWLIRFQVSSW